MKNIGVRVDIKNVVFRKSTQETVSTDFRDQTSALGSFTLKAKIDIGRYTSCLHDICRTKANQKKNDSLQR